MAPDICHLPSAICNFSSAFTLIELLVTTSIIAVIALAIFSTFAAGIKAYQKVQGYMAERDILLALEKIERDLINTFSFTNIAFTGDNKQMSFAGLIGFTAFTNPDSNLSVGKITYHMDADKGTLMKEEQDYSQALSKNAQESNSKILASLKDINLTYYYFNSELKKYDWKNSWQEDSLPGAVKVKMIFNNDNQDVEITRTVVIPLAQ